MKRIQLTSMAILVLLAVTILASTAKSENHLDLDVMSFSLPSEWIKFTNKQPQHSLFVNFIHSLGIRIL